MRGREPAMRGWLDTLDGLRRRSARVSSASGGPALEPRWQPDWFVARWTPRWPTRAGAHRAEPRADRRGRLRPDSTRFLARAAQDGGLPRQITCIDPGTARHPGPR
ncbi:MAG: hypothetical protein U5L06_10750 [Rhodovibrio sp.]|nr:hypothetical protein [Rhodovibrio sp.]